MQARCPSCGSTIEYKSESSAYVVCGACQTLVARKGLDVESVGRVATLQPDGSLLRIGTQGVYNGQSFEIVGRIQVAMGPVDRPDVIWNEWYASFSKGESGWIGEAQGEYFISFVSPMAKVPGAGEIRLGLWTELNGLPAVVTSINHGTALGFEGELPFVMSTSYQAMFVDLSTPSGESATLDYSEDPPICFQGRWVGFDDLKLRGLRQPGDSDDSAPEQIGAANLRSLKCASCGAPHELKAGGITQTLVCGYCDAVMDLNQDMTFKEVLKFEQAKAKVPATIPLGRVGRLPGSKNDYTCIGFMRRRVYVEGTTYRWSEYLLYNPTSGYRWLTESNGHWSALQPSHAVPCDNGGRPIGLPPKSSIRFGSNTFKHFQRTRAVVDYVAGEFPWRVRVGERSHVDDYVAAPLILSADTADKEVNWSVGRYLSGQEIWDAFKLEGRPPAAHGVASNQPNPNTALMNRRWLVYFGVLLAMFGFLMLRKAMVKPPFFDQTFHYKAYEADRVQLVNVTVPPGKHNVTITGYTSLNARWAYVLVSLIDEKTQQTRDSAVTMYAASGYDGGEAWSEVHNRDSVQIANLPGGNYVLRLEPQSNVTGNETPEGAGVKVDFPPTVFSYNIQMQADLPQWGYFWMFLLLGLIPPLWSSWRNSSFETARWSESDYAPE